jgi:hypothetical protein
MSLEGSYDDGVNLPLIKSPEIPTEPGKDIVNYPSIIRIPLITDINGQFDPKVIPDQPEIPVDDRQQPEIRIFPDNNY